MDHLRRRLQEEKEVGRGVIVSYGLGEVNTGGIGSDLEEIAELCEELGAWLHVDAGTLPLPLHTQKACLTSSIRWVRRTSTWYGPLDERHGQSP
jgi:glutamate/tyrosine decarboxylase-like PLP-dependent enzyme